jgi:hypothetical protein
LTDQKKWSLKYDRCVKCGKSEGVKHIARGLCLYCYRQETEKKNRGKQREEIGLAADKLSYEYLFEEYVNKTRSLGDIAKSCSCSRQYVYKQMVEFSIPLRSKQGARELAYDQNKIKFKRFDINGKERTITLDKIRVNEKFFSFWSKEMAYVLGVIYTDGCLDPGSKLDPSRKTTLKMPRFQIFQKEPEILNKVLKLMNCDAKLYHHNKQDLYWFNVHDEKIYHDLQNLGLTPNKSLTMDFPQMPPEYVRHFIRGCWDGDGSVYITGGKIEANYTTGSKIFIEKLVQELYKVGIHKWDRGHSMVDKSEIKRLWLCHPDGKFPLTIHKKKDANSYNIRLATRDNIDRLFHYFYDDVDESMYLTRKYEAFVKGLKINAKVEDEQLTLDLPF